MAAKSHLAVIKYLVCVLLVTTAMAFIAGLAILIYPPLYVLGLGILGRNPSCSLLGGFRGARDYYNFGRKEPVLSYLCGLAREDPAGYQLWKTPDGDFWAPKGSGFVLPILIAQQRTDIYGSGADGIQTGDTVLDCGAHVGVFTKEALKLGARLVVAIEPAPENVECLRRNFSTEIAQGRVIVYPKGVWDKEDSLRLYTYGHNSAADSFVLQTKGAKAIEGIPVTTIDHLTAELSLSKIDYIKMDIEGSLLKALTGARGLLKTQKPRLAISIEEETDNAADTVSAISKMRSDYITECGQCAVENYKVRPLVLFFH